MGRFDFHMGGLGLVFGTLDGWVFWSWMRWVVRKLVSRGVVLILFDGPAGLLPLFEYDGMQHSLSDGLCICLRPG